MRKSLLTILTLSANLSLIGCADDQARQQIADTNVQLSQLQTSVGLLGNKVSNQKALDILNKLDDLQNQIDQLNGSIATLKHDQQTYQTTQDQLYQSLQQQIQSLQPNSGPNITKNSSSAIVASSSDNSNEQLKSALKKVKSHDFPGAINQLKNIIQTSNNPDVVANATYYLAVAYAANGQYKDSIIVVRKFITTNPQSPNAPDALLTAFIAQKQLGMKKSALNTAKLLVKNYPDSSAAKKVQQELPATAN